LFTLNQTESPAMPKRILFLTPQLPYPPHQGTTLRTYGLIDGLAARGHRIALLAFREPGQPAPEDTPLANLCDPLLTIPAPTRTRARRLVDLLAGHADMGRRLWSPPYLAALRDLLAAERFDVIHFEAIEMTAYLHPIRDATGGAALIYDAHNAEHALQARAARQDARIPRRWPLAIYSAVQARRLRRFESAACRAVDRVIAVSEADAAKLRALGHATPIGVIPNAIRAADYAGGGAAADVPHPALVFTGKMDFRPNVDAALWFADDILPRIRAERPAAHFVIAGQKPHARLDGLRGRPGVTLTGWVPDIQPYIEAADVYVAPLRMGSGTRLKILEAMAMGRAVVTTTVGAEGIAARDGEHLLLADSAEAFAEAVGALLADDARRAALGEAAAALVRAHYDWGAIIPRLEVMYDREG
jgi:sugar transferase (PEP-CTERM/EpsH1 system associated)